MEGSGADDIIEDLEDDRRRKTPWGGDLPPASGLVGQVCGCARARRKGVEELIRLERGRVLAARL